MIGYRKVSCKTMTMNIKELHLGLNMISCSRYSDYDDLVINEASWLGMPLIGGTALEVLGSYFGRLDFRKRSDNDLDFVTNDPDAKGRLSEWLKKNIDPAKVKVDVLLVFSHKILTEHILDLGGILVMCPEYIVWSKLRRHSEQDILDIKWLLPSCDFDVLESICEDYGTTEEQLDRLNTIVSEVSQSLSDSKEDINSGCLMLGVDVPFLKELQDVIDPEDLHEYGLEKESHVTVVYGFDTNTCPDFISLGVAVPASSVSLWFTGLSFFENEDYDVLKFDVRSEDLKVLNKTLSDQFSVVSDYAEYNPHCTVAYLKSGSAAKYRGLVADFLNNYEMPVLVSSTEWLYSTQSS